MANRALNYSHLFVIVVLLVAGGSMMLVAVEASNNELICMDSLGACGPAGECNKKCKAMHSDGAGSCGFNLCTCVYSDGCKRSVVKKNAAVKLDCALLLIFIAFMALAIQSVLTNTIMV
ncbi:PREDICTED: uncharacterized protein LOC109326760 isoform X2 [Lupinus angustifolius]|uniref:uncharacterized protein LOC109326760 isoform X2 n=1 Tax=Lupinus angustifolius TaxID=3871 RepID=UPI00092F4C2C|nr:PREDICTED: uncharacterized protein LOC109326760 isoform X2 [Lupinus angustifolius]